MIEYRRHPRAKNYKITLKPDGRILVTIPNFGTQRKAEAFLASKQDWIAAQQAKRPPVPPLSAVEIERLRAEAKSYIPQRVAVLADQYGFNYHTVRIKNMTSRWGSCSSRGNLNFSLHLMRLPGVYIDYVILHELCHTQEMNHGPGFWNLLESVCPGAKKIDRALRKQGVAIG